ncbi:rabphilin-3A isoform X4 [Athalia rosae]|uniref:rabphilin-3A isoform X4 n=1 Tax=Athalia rosae TaxID=37344 RepID=UPI0020343AC1|nr:rabphilin-3A isoform X4 [Athalia rosae]
MVDLGDTNNRGGRWVCPNDRHLALRAKLRTGWSVKTGSLDYRNDYPSGSSQLSLTEEERCTIIEVIRRAEALDLSEQERVGRLVDRLENMKRNCVSSGNLSTSEHSYSRYSCALCGEKFTVLGAGPAICKDCRKHICQKCGIEATTMPCGTQQAAGSTQNSQRPRLFLCRICSETREMWKKSGAWFFKGLPKYVLPEKKVDRGRSRRSSRASSWAVVNNLRPLESGEPDSSSDEDIGRRLAMSRSLGPNDVPLTPGSDDKYRSSTPVYASRDVYSRQNSSNTGDSSNNGIRSAEIDGNQQGQFPSSTSLQPLAQSPRGHPVGMQGRNFVPFQSQTTNAVDQRQSSSDQLNCNQERFSRVEQQPGIPNVGPTSGSQSPALSRTGPGDFNHEQRGSDHQQSQPVPCLAANSSGTSCVSGGWIRDTGSLVAIRPRGTVPPVQSTTCPRSASYGYPRADRFILQAQYPTRRDRKPLATTEDKNGPQDAGSGIQRDGHLLRYHGDRHEKWQGTAYIGSSRRSSGQGFSRGGETSALSIAAVSDDSLQCLPGESSPVGSRRGSLGRGSEPAGSNSGDLELQYSQARSFSQRFARCESAGNGHQRVL